MTRIITTYGQLLSVAMGQTLLLALYGLFFACIIGMIVGIMSVLKNRFCRVFAAVFVNLIRGVPMIVLAYFVFFGVPYFWNTVLGIGGLTRADIVDVFPALLVSDSGAVSTSMAWAVQAARNVNGKWQRFEYAVDDATGILLVAEYIEDSADVELPEDYTMPDWSKAVQRIVDNLAASYAFSDTTMSLQGSASLNPYTAVYNVYYTNGQGTVLGLPIVIGRDNWAINFYDGA